MPDDLLLISPDAAADDPAIQEAPDGRLLLHIIRSVPPTHTTHAVYAISGVQKLVQEVYMQLLTNRTPDGDGSDVVRIMSSAASEQALRSALVQAFAGIHTRILELQAGAGLPDDERLATLRLLRIQFNNVSRQFDVDLEVTAASGALAVLNYKNPVAA